MGRNLHPSSVATSIALVAWPGLPAATWPCAQPGANAFTPPRGRGIQKIPEDVPLACWLPVKQGITAHGLRHSHRTWIAEDGIPEILAGP
jgi:hypothetical protein